MAKFKIISVLSVVIAGAVASILIRHHGQTKLDAGDRRLQEQSKQLAALTAEHERLSNLKPQVSSGGADVNAVELARLRPELAGLQRRTNDLAHRPATSRRSQSPGQASAGDEPHSEEYYTQLRLLAANKHIEAKDLGFAFREYVEDHQNQSPTSISQLMPYMAAKNRPWSGSNQYEIIYQGSLDKLQGLPWGSIAVLRDQQSWPGPNGMMMRVYGFPDGHSQMVSADSFQSFEAQHVIRPQATTQAGP